MNCRIVAVTRVLGRWQDYRRSSCVDGRMTRRRLRFAHGHFPYSEDSIMIATLDEWQSERRELDCSVTMKNTKMVTFLLSGTRRMAALPTRIEYSSMVWYVFERLCYANRRILTKGPASNLVQVCGLKASSLNQGQRATIMWVVVKIMVPLWVP